MRRSNSSFHVLLLVLLSQFYQKHSHGFTQPMLLLHQNRRPTQPRRDHVYGSLSTAQRIDALRVRSAPGDIIEKTPWYSSRSLQWLTLTAVYLFHQVVSSRHMWAVGGLALMTLMSFRNKHSSPFRLPDMDDTRFRLSTVISLIALFFGYLQMGKLSLFWEDIILELSNLDWPITVSTARALQVLFSHLSWSVTVVLVLAAIPFPAVFRPRAMMAQQPEESTGGGRAFYWFTWKSRNWVHWASVGFLASHVVFAIADGLNHRLLPAPVISKPNPSIVSQLVVGNRIGFIAPCISAPFLEELLYRGFLWPALTTLLGGFTLAANVIQAIVFSAHHVSTTGAVPLAALGFFWAWLYKKSGSLATVVAVHVMWNARVFVSAWLFGH